MSVELLLKLGADPNICRAPVGISLSSPLSGAAANGHVEVAAALIRAGARVDAACGERPMDVAVSNGKVDVVRLLLASGADPTARTAGGWTYLMQAAQAAQPAVIPILVKAGCPLEAMRPRVRESSNDSDGQTALMMAAAWDPRPTRAMIAAGANVNARDSSGATPLIHAVRGAIWTADNGLTSPGKWHPSIVSMLLAAGANPNLADASGETPLELASKAGPYSARIRTLLSEAGAK
jgi:ankyrin repeat protein